MRDSLFAYSDRPNFPLGKRVSWTVCVLAVGLMTFLFNSSVAAENGATSDAKAQVTPKVEAELAWYNPAQWGVEGKGWTETKRYYDRFPAKAEGTVRGSVWNLSRHSAGIAVRFATDSKQVRVRYRLFEPQLAMSHMPATGVSGVDLYARQEGRWHWLGVVRPGKQEVNATLAQGLEPKRREYLLYLPLYNGADDLEIGVDAGAKFEPFSPREKPIVFYGTSITQGGCCSRPGRAYASFIGRALERPIVNLGFSGNGRMESEVADLLAEIDASAFVIDCLPNMSTQMVTERVEPFVRKIRQARPETPIVLVEELTYSNTVFYPEKQKVTAEKRAALRATFDKLKAEGFSQLYYVDGEPLLGSDGEATVDGVHPNDLGMFRMAKYLTPFIHGALSAAQESADAK